MGAMADPRPATPRPEQLLAIIELQNALAAAGLNADEAMSMIVERIATLTPATGAAVALGEGDDLVVRAASRPAAGDAPARLPRAGAAGACIAERRPILIEDAAADPRVDAETRARVGGGALAYAPLLYGENAVGAIEAHAPRAGALGEEDVEVLRLLAQIIAIGLHRAYATRGRARTSSTTR